MTYPIMKYTFFLIIIFTLLGAGCQGVRQVSSDPSSPTSTGTRQKQDGNNQSVVLPVNGNIVGYNATYKLFGEYFKDRFLGYHVADDIEVPQEDLGPGEVQEVPVRSMADGIVRRIDWVSGYGGVMLVTHDVDNRKITAIYGHIDLNSTKLKDGDSVSKGQFLANLGDGRTRETDGERQHLHFGLYEGEELRIRGYELDAKTVDTWINPYDFFDSQGLWDKENTFAEKSYVSLVEPSGRKFFKIDFRMPSDWDVEYIPSIQALNLYTVSGPGTARERSQIFIRYFDANNFLTLPTVTIHSTRDLTVGLEAYKARRYDIEKKSGVADFPDQPTWRNERHMVTDFTTGTGRTRYYVVAKNPDLSMTMYEQVLRSMQILK